MVSNKWELVVFPDTIFENIFSSDREVGEKKIIQLLIQFLELNLVIAWLTVLGDLSSPTPAALTTGRYGKSGPETWKDKFMHHHAEGTWNLPFIFVLSFFLITPIKFNKL